MAHTLHHNGKPLSSACATIRGGACQSTCAPRNPARTSIADQHADLPDTLAICTVVQPPIEESKSFLDADPKKMLELGLAFANQDAGCIRYLSMLLPTQRMQATSPSISEINFALDVNARRGAHCGD